MAVFQTQKRQNGLELIRPFSGRSSHVEKITAEPALIFHHSGLDVLDSVHLRELDLGAVIMAIMAYSLAQEGI